MTDTPSLPPTPRRRALARQAGQVPLSRPLIGAAAWAAGTAAVAWTGAEIARAIAAMAAREIRAAAAAGDPISMAGPSLRAAVEVATALAAPLAVAVAAVATLTHLAQTRSLWLPRRGVRGAPVPRDRAARRVVDAAIGAVALAAVLGILGHFAYAHGGDLVRAGSTPRGLGLVAVALVRVASALVVVAVADWLVRLARHGADLAMTPRERRDDERQAAADPRWRRARRARAAEGSAAAVAGCAVVVVDDRAAAAIRWDARWSPVPRVAAGGIDRAARSIIALARRHGVPVQRDDELAAALSRLPGDAPVPTALHARLARHLAALGR